jgi:filamentous hemagglutinin family protein
MRKFWEISIRNASIFALSLLLWQLGGRTACANPTGGIVSQGTATFSTSGSQMTINAANNTFINWQSFNIGLNETTTFVQPSSSSLVWNQINSANPSQILGNLNANGYVVLQNQNGFYVGGSAAINTHGLLMTTAPIAMPDLSSGGAWQFDAPPPTAKIINYGQINIAGGGSAFLIADNIENNGTISAPGGNIGLYAGKKVLVSSSPDGRGLSAEVTLPQGSVDNQGNLIADGGSIVAQAKTVNQNGLIQANSVQDINGTIELVASDSVNLGANSVISAKGDGTGTSSGGSVSIKSGNTFSDQAGSTINISGGAQGGNGGQAEISAPHMSAINSIINGQAVAGFVGGLLTIDPMNIWLASSDSDPSAPSGYTVINVNSFNGMSTINVEADQNIELSTVWNLTDPGVPAALNLTAGNDIILDDETAIVGGNNWSVNLTAGTALPSGSTPASGNDGIYLNGSSFIQTRNGNINLYAPNEVIVNSGAIRTVAGGNINVTTMYGDVNTGTSTAGFNYISQAPYFSPFSKRGPNAFGTATSLGGISTAAGGNVTITAGGDVISYLPSGPDPGDGSVSGDAGTGAFGSLPGQVGNVTITAGGSVYGNYVEVNGTGTINAGQDIGNDSQNVALSLVTGSWNLNAGWDSITKTVLSGIGNIYLQEVRNPNGVFNATGNSGSGGNHFFDYDPHAAVSLTAGDGVYLTGQNLPRTSDTIVDGVNDLPIILPPTLTIYAGAGGVTLEDNVTLFPSSYGDLNITTTDGGNFGSDNPSGTPYELLMSDSSQPHWYISDSGTQPFSSTDHGSTPIELDNYDPVLIDISGSMSDLTLQTTKATQINIGGDMTGCSFYGQNLHAGDVTSIDVGGQISNPGSFNFVNLNQGIQNVPLADLPPNTLNNWQTLLTLAVDPNKIDAQTIPAGIDPSQYATYVAQDLLFGESLQSSFAYDPTTQRLTFIGSMSQSILNALDQPLTVLVYGPNGYPEVDENPKDANYGHFVTTTINWINPATDPNAIPTLYTESQGAPALGNSGGGYVVGGTGQFDINAASISLGNSYGILSLGDGQLVGADYSYLTPELQNQPGATINVTVHNDVTVDGVTTASLNMPSSTIAALGGGDVNVTSTGGSMDLGSQYLVEFEAEIMTRDNLGLGIYTSGGGNINVTAEDTIDVDSSRIATFDGGDIYIESLTGDVNAGSGGTVAIPVNAFSPEAPSLTQPFEYVYANGIVAQTLVNASEIPGSAILPGNITIVTPEGDILASEGGILQEALNGNISAGPTINLTAGSLGHIGNVNLGDSGVIGGTVNVTASGNITGLVISRQNSDINAAQSFSGTVLSGGTASLSAGGSVSGTIIGGAGVNATAGGAISAALLGQNVSVNGGAAASTLGTATATGVSQSAAATSNNSATQEVADNTSQDDDQKKKKHPALQRVKRVTVILPKAS